MIVKKINFFLLACVILYLFVNSTPKKQLQLDDTYQVYLMDTARSRINWKNYHNGYLKFKKGIILVKNQDIVNADFVVDMHSIADMDIDNKLLNGTLVNVLKSEEFFNVSIFPEAKFELHNITHLKDQNYLFSGDFIILNDGVCYDFEGTISLRKDSLYIQTKTFGIDRTDWGIYYLSERNPYPKEEEAGYVVTDSIFINTQIVAYKKNTEK